MNPRDLFFAISMLLLMIGMVRTGVAFASDPVELTPNVIEKSLIGKGVLSNSPASGTLSHRELRRDGSVAASRSGRGIASG